jgi:predicted MFS family arabinose efflux permease
MNLNTLKLLLPVVAVTIQNNSASTLIPPFLQDLNMPVVAIGTLISLNPIFALLSRLPVGMAYRHSRARLLIGVGVIVMGITNFLYSFVTGSVSFAIVHSVNGFAYGAVTTLYMAFYVDSLPPEENRNHAMGYYVGTLALGYSTGNFFGGLIADYLGYRITFQLAAYLSLLPCFLLWLFNAGEEHGARAGGEKKRAILASREIWKALPEPGLAIVVITAFFLNLIHQMGGVFISLYGLAVGMNLTHIGTIRAAYAGCNAVTRPTADTW